MSYRLTRRALLRCAQGLLVLSAAAAAQAADEFAVTPAQLQALGVRLQRLEQPAPISGHTFPARVVLPPSQEYVLSAPVAGVVDQLLVGENDRVQVGQPLLRLVSPELGELQLKLSEAASKGRLSHKTLARERLLFADGIVPQRRVLEAESAAAEDQARQRQAEAALRLAGLDAPTIRRVADGGAMQDALVLRARSPGVVVKLDAKPGLRTQSADALMRIADTRKLWLDIQIPVDRQAQVATKGAQITGVDRDLGATPLGFGATVSDSQTVMLRAEVKQGAQALRLGEFVQVRVPFASTEDGWPVPVAALARQGDKAYVFVRTDKGFVATPVTVQDGAGQALRVTGALRSGQEIAVSSVIALKAAWLGKGGSN
ncbi:efflux RND transporter periplasmic adaptor subunit [Rhodoferax sp.]|uniref:efflux RND transporter periplasmic adaptor subunit n=1 Tax=Rhodoferax sp. TaxID=50421 RepID=UPI0027716057|nr:efflux RND transporter periplasmic adaptor subunit [Rhodoferax sp.]